MPEVTQAASPNKTEERTLLKNVGPGKIFRYPSVSFEKALSGEEGAQHFFMVIAVQPNKTGRVAVVSTDGRIVLERDDDHEVIVHPSQLVVAPAKMVDRI